MLDSKIDKIAVREFLRTFTALTQKKTRKRFLVMRHGKPIGVFIPYDHIMREQKTGEPWSAIDGLVALRFKSGENNLSQRIDEIVYGISRESMPD